MNKSFFLFLSLMFFYGAFISAQDLCFSQYFLNSLDQNPAVAGSANDPRIFLHYRNQWPTLEKGFVTYQGSYDQYITKMNGGVGLNIIQDNIANGIITNTQLDLIYSYRFKASKKLTMQAGLQATFQYYNVNPGSLSTNSAVQVPPSSKTAQPDFAIGCLGTTRYSQFGISVNHLNSGFIRFNYNYFVSPLKIGLYYSRNISLYNPNKIQPTVFTLTPALLVQKQSGSTYINYGAGLRQGNILGGLWLRTNLPFQLTTTIFSAGFTLNSWQFIYSYDYNLLSTKNIMPVTGAHEITITTTFPLDPKRKRYSGIECPNILQQ
jgi:type IX secretion system PorP/SprF family membrane protein